MKIHEREFACEICGSSFLKKVDLDQHLKSHEQKEENIDVNVGVLRSRVEAVK